jgi:glutamyl/glutaminyl-tRNA synthetase
VSVTDELLGTLTHHLPETIGDVVLRRADGIWSYQMCVVVDDIDQKISEVVRGQDLWQSTPRQAALYAALGAPLPKYWHAPLVTDNAGEKLSKRDGANSLGTLPLSSGGPTAVVGLLASTLGLVRRGARLSAQDLLTSIDLEQLERAFRRPSGPTYRPMRPRVG